MNKTLATIIADGKPLSKLSATKLSALYESQTVTRVSASISMAIDDEILRRLTSKDA